MREIRFDENRPGIYNLLLIYEAFTGLKKAEIEARFDGMGYEPFKRELSEVVIESLRPLQRRYGELTTDPNYIDSVLAEGVHKSKPIAEQTLSGVKGKIGLR